MAAGLYIHVPFCLSKCPYCDFYSITNADDALKDTYAEAVKRTLQAARADGFADADTLYFGGGTPSLLGGARIASLIEAASPLLSSAPEITLEANPADDLKDTLRVFALAGGNRLSMGMQSANESELTFLGRRHTGDMLERAVSDTFAAGIDNLSLDMMLGLSGQTADSVAASVKACHRLGASHVSAYLLKVEQGTPFSTRALHLPDEDKTAELYLAACALLEVHGYRQYEISNFAIPGKESRHNLKYWNAEAYLGIGPAAHSFLDGKRCSYPRSLDSFLRGDAPLEENSEDTAFPNGSPEEYAMLRLRLTQGLTEREFTARFDKPIPTRWRERAAALPSHLVVSDANGIRFTQEGFLLSNFLTTRIL